MEEWQRILKESITDLNTLPPKLHPGENSTLDKVIADFPMRINPYFLQLIEKAGDPLWLQAVPCAAEGEDSCCIPDPLGEEEQSPVPNLVHKYPDRALLLVSHQCAMYCRFCTRKRKVGNAQKMGIRPDNIKAACTYLKQHQEIREVLLSGGDPLLLADERLDEILYQLHKIPNISVIRIGSRVPSTLPMRITDKLVAILKKYHPLYLNTQFNHPKELSAEAKEACRKLADAGIPLGCQTVLLRGINDSPQTIENLMRTLLQARVKPYYLFQGDLSLGTNHFRTPVETGIAIMHHLYANVSGMATPTFAIDAPDGSGKIPLTPNYIQELSRQTLVFKNINGTSCIYPQAQLE